MPGIRSTNPRHLDPFGPKRIFEAGSSALSAAEALLGEIEGDLCWAWSYPASPATIGERRLNERAASCEPLDWLRLGMIPMESGSLIMERKMLIGIKQRAERLEAEQK